MPADEGVDAVNWFKTLPKQSEQRIVESAVVESEEK